MKKSGSSPAADEFAPILTPGDGSHAGTCLIASGVAFAHAWDCPRWSWASWAESISIR